MHSDRQTATTYLPPATGTPERAPGTALREAVVPVRLGRDVARGAAERVVHGGPRQPARGAEVRGRDAVLAAERLGELRGLPVADAVGDLADRHPADTEQLGGPMHPHLRQVIAEGGVADL